MPDDAHRLKRRLFRLALAAPAIIMLGALVRGSALAMDLLGPSGEMAVRLMIAAMLVGPLTDYFGARRPLRIWLRLRRDLGLASCGYALLHLVLYVADMRLPRAMIEELALPSIWTGWLALAFLLVPASISFDAAVRKLGPQWKSLQRCVYAALLVSLAHWLLLAWDWLPALLHVIPLVAAWTLRAIARQRGTLLRRG